eukprot:g47338.t1
MVVIEAKGLKKLIILCTVHCFHYLIPLAKQGNYAIVANAESMDYDPLVVRLNKDISAIEEAMSGSLQQHKFQYIFEGGKGIVMATSAMSISDSQISSMLDGKEESTGSRTVGMAVEELGTFCSCTICEFAAFIWSTCKFRTITPTRTYFKRISESGIKKMCRNIFVLQQNLTNITMSREADLDFA